MLFILPQVGIVNVNYARRERIMKDIFEDFEREYQHRWLYLPEKIIFFEIKKSTTAIVLKGTFSWKRNACKSASCISS